MGKEQNIKTIPVPFKDEIAIAESWFQQKGWKSFPFQKQTWEAFLQGKNGLLNAPTGSGKTYALWIPIVLNYIKNNPDYKKNIQADSRQSGLLPYAHFR